MNVERIEFVRDLEKRVAFASVKIGDVSISGVAIWRSGNGRLRVFFPSYRRDRGYDDAISLPPDLRTEVEAEVITAYKLAKSEAQEREKQQASTV